MKAVENGGTAIGIRCKDGVVLAVEKIITSKLLKPGANKKIATVDRHVGIVRHCKALSTMELSALHIIANKHLLHRCQLDWSLTVDTLSPERETKPPRGEAYTRAPFQFLPLRTVWVAMYKLSLYIPAYDHSG